jgi:DNA repair protein RadC
MTQGIKNWSEDDRPREKLLSKSAGALTDAELLAILINSGTRSKSALDLAREVLQLAHNNLNEMGKLGLEQLQQIKGIGQARAITLTAAIELGRRRQISAAIHRESISRSEDAAELIIPLLKDLNHEAFYVIYINQAGKLIKYEKLSDGGLTATIADIRIILKNALLCQSNRIIVAHNHPSGNLIASHADKELTRKLKESASLMDITLLDHLIISGNRFLSMADEGYL